MIENRAAYQRAIHERIKANASTTRRRKLDAAIAGDSELFRCWLLGGLTTEEREAVKARREADLAAGACEMWNRSTDPARPWMECRKHYDSNCPADQMASEIVNGRYKALGYVPKFLDESLQNWGGLSDKQLAMARDIFAERQGKATERAAQRAAERAAAEPWTAGRQVVEGVILKIKETEGFGYGPYGATAHKMIVKTDRFQTIYCSLPSSIYAAKAGARVRFTVDVQPKQDDPTFAFGKRPTKASLVTPAEIKESQP